MLIVADVDLRASRVLRKVLIVCLSQRLPTLDIEGGGRTFHVLVVSRKFFLSEGME